MRDFFRRRIPQPGRVLLVESGSRSVCEKLLAVLRGLYGQQLPIDLITCYPGLPEGFSPQPTTAPGPTAGAPQLISGTPQPLAVFRVSDYRGRAGRRRLYSELSRRRYPVLGIICSGEPIMTKWKWAVVARVPAKVFVANENGDFFWLDYSQWQIMVRFALHRSGLAGPGAIRGFARLALFPITLAYLLLYAAVAHLRRAFNLLFRTS